MQRDRFRSEGRVTTSLRVLFSATVADAVVMPTQGVALYEDGKLLWSYGPSLAALLPGKGENRAVLSSAVLGLLAEDRPGVGKVKQRQVEGDAGFPFTSIGQMRRNR